MTAAIATLMVSGGWVQAKPVPTPSPQPRPATRSTSSPKPSPQQAKQGIQFAAPPLPANIGEPGQRTEAGSRGCGRITNLATASPSPLTAVVPTYPASEVVLGVTSAAYPTFWFYNPYPSSAPAEFVLQDSAGQLLYQTHVTLPEPSGIMSLTLDQMPEPLVIGQRYQWFLKVYCEDQSPPAYVEGWIQRTTLDPHLNLRLAKATLRDRVTFYAAHGIWFDALSAAGELHCRDPQDGAWTGLLQAVGLSNLASEPIQSVCLSKLR
jgi:hypothetical protein